jgi:hypothetical protein
LEWLGEPRGWLSGGRGSHLNLFLPDLPGILKNDVQTLSVAQTSESLNGQFNDAAAMLGLQRMLSCLARLLVLSRPRPRARQPGPWEREGRGAGRRPPEGEGTALEVS